MLWQPHFKLGLLQKAMSSAPEGQVIDQTQVLAGQAMKELPSILLLSLRAPNLPRQLRY